MARMGRWAQSVDDPEVEVGDRGVGGGWDGGEIAAIGEVGDAEAKGIDVPVVLEENGDVDGAAGAGYLKYLARLDCVGVEDRRIIAAGRRDEAVAEGFIEAFSACGAEVDVDAATVVEGQYSEVVDAVGVVGVLVGVEHGVDTIDLGVEQLLAEIDAGVDQDSRWLFNTLRPAFDQERAAAAAVARIRGIADAPVIADARDAAGGTAA